MGILIIAVLVSTNPLLIFDFDADCRLVHKSLNQSINQRSCWRVGGTPQCAGAPRGVVPPCGPPAVLCAPLWWTRAPCAAPPLRWVLAPCAGAPPRCCGPDRDHCYDRLEATAPHRIQSLAPWTHQGSGHPHAYGSCVRRAGMVHAVIHSPQQAFSQQSSGAAASRSRSHSSATNMVAAPVMLP